MTSRGAGAEIAAVLLALVLAAAASCPEVPAKLPTRPGRASTCASGSLRTRAYELPAPFAGHVVVRTWDEGPLALGGAERVSFALRLPGGAVAEGRDLTDLLRRGELRPKDAAEAGLLVGASLLAAFDEVHGPARLPGGEALAKDLAHLPPPHARALPGGGFEVLVYGRSKARGPGDAERITVDQVRVTLVPDQGRLLAEPEVGRIFEKGRDAGRTWEAWRPDRAPPP